MSGSGMRLGADTAKGTAFGSRQILNGSPVIAVTRPSKIVLNSLMSESLDASIATLEQVHVAAAVVLSDSGS